MKFILLSILVGTVLAETCPKHCSSWFDGCNHCQCSANGTACTKKACETYKPSNCTEWIPRIQIIGDQRLKLEQQDSEYTDEGATCYDQQGNEVRARVTGDIVDLRKSDNYTIEYECDGTEIRSSRTIQIVEPGVPLIACLEIYKPLCCNGKTLSNECYAERAGFNLLRDCSPGACPVMCPTIWQPICCYGNTFSNDCVARNNGFAKGCSKGACIEPCMMVYCLPGYSLVNTDDRGCGGECVEPESEINYTLVYSALVGGICLLIFIGIMIANSVGMRTLCWQSMCPTNEKAVQEGKKVDKEDDINNKNVSKIELNF